MTDVMTKEQRSYNMSRIRSKWTSPERKIHNILKGRKVKHKMHPKIEGNPDIIISEHKIAVFIHGCFWHKCPKCFKAPSTRVDFWSKKIEDTIKRDKESTRKLKSNGWKIIRIWEHEIRKDSYTAVKKIIKLV